MFRPTLVCATSLLLASSLLAAEFEEQKLHNWHQWRGPLSTGVAPNGDPPTEWSETKNIKWKVKIPGRGSATPIVWGDRIFVLTALKTDRTAESAEAADGSGSAARYASTEGGSRRAIYHLLAQREERRGGDRRGRGFGRGGFGGDQPTDVHQFVVMCIDRKTGQTIWQDVAAELVPHEGHHQTGSFASSSPVTDGERLYASFGSRGFYCYDLQGKQIWQKDLGDMQIRLSFGEGASPALHEDTLVVTWDHEGESFIVALDARTGDEKWRQPRDEPSTWATPLVVEAAGRTQVITSGTNRVRSYDLANGELIWECGGLGSNPIATPVVYENLAIVMTGHRDPAGIAVRLDAKGDVTGGDEVAWRIERTTPYVPSPLLYDSTLYFTRSRNAILTSVDAGTGEAIIDQERLPEMDSIYASPVAAKGRIYFSSREGTTTVIEHSPTFQVLATNTLNETIDASPAIIGNELFIRGEEHLYCISEE